MATIGKRNFNVKVDGVSNVIDFTVMYTNGVFYIKVSEDLKKFAELLDEKQRNDFVIKVEYPKGHRSITSAEMNFFVKGKTESETIENYRRFVYFVKTSQVKVREVIILHYESGHGSHYGGWSYSPGLTKNSMALGITYATETSIPGSEPVYRRINESKDIMGRDITLARNWINNMTVIDLTPKNKEFVERIYTLLKELDTKLSEHLATPESLLIAVNNGIRMITQ